MNRGDILKAAARAIYKALGNGTNGNAFVFYKQALYFIDMAHQRMLDGANELCEIAMSTAADYMEAGRLANDAN